MRKISYLFSDFVIGVLSLNYLFIKRVVKREICNLKDLDVLDFGCGTGVLARMFSRKNYVGFDLDKDAIFFAKERHPGFKFLVGDATSFKVNKKFDLVLVVGVLHHLSNSQVKEASRRIRGLLKPSAKVLIIEATQPVNSLNLVGTLLRKLDKGSYVRSPGEYSRLISQGLKVVRMYKQKGGILDYAVLVAGGKGN